MVDNSPRNGAASRRLWTRILQVGAVVLLLALLYEGVRGLAPEQSRAETRDFSGTTVKGETWSLSDRLGKKPVLVNFFATWCGPCRMEYPELLELHRKYRDQGFEVVMLTRESLDEVKPHEALMNSPIPIITDAGDVFDAYGVDGIPHTFYYNRDGKLTHEIQGYGPGELQRIEQDLQSGGDGGQQSADTTR
jgi:thiol-disulfide isomerase/thioredoxin